MRYSIETRRLSPSAERPALEDGLPSRESVDAESAERAVQRFASAQKSKVVACVSPNGGRESIATLTRQGMLYLVRVMRD